MLAAFIALFAGLTVAVGQEPPVDPQSRRTIEADTRFLSSDLLLGRDPGTPGFDIAAAYVASAFSGIGLKPAGDDGTYHQNITFQSSTPTLPGGATLSLGTPGAEQAWRPKVDYIGGGQDGAVLDNVPIVFAGYGLVAAHHGRDDFAGLDVDGKIVAMISGAPKFLNSEERAHYRGQRVKAAADRGAVGVISLLLPSYEERVRPFAQIAAGVDGRRSVTWLDEDGVPWSRNPSIKASITLGQIGAAKLFEAAGKDWTAATIAAEDEAGAVRGFDMGLTASIRVEREAQTFESANVIGILPGSDPTLRREIIAVTAHLDHLGTRRSIDPEADNIYNGAMDNAVGVAGIIDIARRLAKNPPKRSVMFVALTAEERGLLGSRYLVRQWDHRTMPIVGAFNFDMPILHEDFTDIVTFGLERTTMEPAIRAAIEGWGLNVAPDPYPEQGFFTRSDQYSFVEVGIPAAYIDQATRPGAEAETQTFLRTIYHKVVDEADLVYFDDLARFAALNAVAIEGAANMPIRPLWRAGDFFGRTFGGPMEETAQAAGD